jgi:RNA polymerase sigma factor (sigma-70 family)
MTPDSELLRQFADNGDQDAFAELMGRKINAIYAAALRQVGCDSHLAVDVTQGVFLALAQRAPSLKRHPALSAWLHTTTRFLAAKAMRSQQRRRRYEEEALAMKTLLEGDEPSWERLRPVIDEALNELSERDREPILLRFFENRSFADVGEIIGLTENAARMRMERALEKLRVRLARRGVTSTAVGLAVVLTNQPAVAAPAGLAASVSVLAGGALVGATLGTGSGAVAAAGSWLLPFMNTTKAVVSLVGFAVAVGVGAYIGAYIQSNRFDADSHAEAVHLRETNEHLRNKLAAMEAAAATMTPNRAATPAVSAPAESSASDRLRVLVELQKRRLVNPAIGFVAPSGTLTPAFVELFGLTPTEQKRLQQIVDDARERLAELERKNANTSRMPNGDVVIHVNAFPETGGAVYDSLVNSFAETLGPDRHEAFLTLGVEQVEKALGRFGTPQRAITLSRQPSSPDGEPRYAISEQYKLPTETGNFTSDAIEFEQLKERVGTITRLLPSDFVP